MVDFLTLVDGGIALHTHTVDVFFLILRDNWTLHFYIEDQKAILKGLYRK